MTGLLRSKGWWVGVESRRPGFKGFALCGVRITLARKSGWEDVPALLSSLQGQGPMGKSWLRTVSGVTAVFEASPLIMYTLEARLPSGLPWRGRQHRSKLITEIATIY